MCNFVSIQKSSVVTSVEFSVSMKVCGIHIYIRALDDYETPLDKTKVKPEEELLQSWK